MCLEKQVKIGITGHQILEDSANWDWIELEIDNILTQAPKPFVGVTSLAIGSDQLFAKAVLKHGGDLTVIVPFDEYKFTFKEGDERQQYYRLLNEAKAVKILPRMASDEESYFEAGKQLVDIVDFLVAVWDGKPARGLGGTADIVRYARQCNKKVVHCNPISHIVSEIND